MKHFVYIIYSARLDVYYKGYTQNVASRLQKHLLSEHKYTSQTNDWVIVYLKEYPTKREALIEEKRLKRLNRRSIEKLIGC